MTPSPVLLALLALPLAAGAQDGSPSPGEGGGPQTTSAQRVEITARQGSNELRRAASVAKQIYGREELDRFGDNSASDVLRRLPGVNIGAGGPRMRGLGSGYTQILINGDPMPPGFQLDQLNPSQIERIEVLRAPTADQSAQAIAGTINIILKDAPRRSQRDLRLGLANGSDRPTASANFTFGESKPPLSFSLPVSLFEWQRENRNDIDRAQAGTDGQPARARQFGAQPVWGWGYNLGPRLNWRQGDEQSLGLQSFLQQINWNNRTTYRNEVLAGSPVLDDDSQAHGRWESGNVNMTWAWRFREDQRIELKAGANGSRWNYDSRNLRQGALRQRAVGDGKDQGLTQAGKYSLLLGQAHSATVGWDLETRRRDETRIVTDANDQPVAGDFEGQPFASRVRRQALYLQDEWELSPQWQMYLGLRHEQIRTESRGSGTTPVVNTSRVLSPLWHLTHKLDTQGRDMVRASLTRSYKAPNAGSLLARPSVSSQYLDTTQPNTELAPDRIGNAALKPELSSGLDIAYEKYLPQGSLISVGLFHRRLRDVVRNVTTLQSVPWATVPRWVSQPVNFTAATTSGVELEVKGSAAELLPSLLPEARSLNLRASLNLYRSRVAVLPGPDNRLDGQQPWSATLGFDQRLTSLPLVVGGSLGLNPAYDTRLTLDQWQERSRTRSVDAFAQWTFRPGLSARLAASAGVQPFGPPNGHTLTRLANGDFSKLERSTGPQLNLSLDMRL